jgi:hypothetical protein
MCVVQLSCKIKLKKNDNRSNLPKKKHLFDVHGLFDFFWIFFEFYWNFFEFFWVHNLSRDQSSYMRRKILAKFCHKPEMKVFKKKLLSILLFYWQVPVS